MMSLNRSGRELAPRGDVCVCVCVFLVVWFDRMQNMLGWVGCMLCGKSCLCCLSGAQEQP